MNCDLKALGKAAVAYLRHHSILLEKLRKKQVKMTNNPAKIRTV